MFGTIFLIVVICIGGLLVAFNTNYFQGSQGLQGIAGINGLDFNSTIPYTFLFNGTQGIQGIQGNIGSSGLISVSLPLVNNSGVLSLNTLSLTHNNLTDWSSATSSFLTSDDDSAYLTVNSNLNASKINMGTISSSYLPIITYGMTNFADQALLTTSNPLFSDNSIGIGTVIGLSGNGIIYLSGDSSKINFRATINNNYFIGWSNNNGLDGLFFSATQGFQWYSVANTKITMTLDGSGSLTLTNILNSAGYDNSNPSVSQPSRSLNSVYHNISGVEIIVYVCCYVTGNITPNTNSFSWNIGSTSGVSNGIGFMTNAVVGQYSTCSFIVPNNWYYKVSSSGTVGIQSWNESPL